MIRRLTDFPPHVLAFAVSGEITRRDYRDVLEPMVEAALQRPGKLRMYYQLDADFIGFEPGAIWEDFNVGIAHLLRWKRIAVVTDVDWVRGAAAMFGFMMPCSVRAFPLAEAADARAWIVADG